MFVIQEGLVEVVQELDDQEVCLAVKGPGEVIGEMAIFERQARSATVRADGDCYVMEIGKPMMGKVLSDAPDCLVLLSELLAQRRMETEGILKEAKSSDHALTERQYTANFLQRLRTFFQL